MTTPDRNNARFLVAAVLVLSLAAIADAQAPGTTRVAKPNLPNPYRLVPDWPTLPASMKGPNGRKWGEVIRVHVAPNGNIWVFHRCFHDQPNGDATCLNRGEANPPILEFNPAGRLLKSFGVGLFAHPHGFTVDKDGNIWATDTNDEETILGMPAKNAQGVTMGQQVLKISPAGKVLMTIGTPGVSGNGPYHVRPADGSVHCGQRRHLRGGWPFRQQVEERSHREVFAATARSSRRGDAWDRNPATSGIPHDLYVGGSKGYVYVADRQNNRIQVFDQDGNFIAAWTQFGQPSSVYVDKHDNIYVGATYQDPSRGSVKRATTGPNDRAIVIGNAITGELKYLIPDPGDLSKMTDTGTSASGIAVDDQGNIYAADVGFNNLRKYIKVQ